jgi:hypothetical protein
MNIEFLYYEDCPSHDQALERLEQVMAEEGIIADIKITKIETESQAIERQFVGSPTILVDGQDIVPPVENAQFGLGCRVYRLENGRFSPLPSVTMIRNALKSVE